MIQNDKTIHGQLIDMLEDLDARLSSIVDNGQDAPVVVLDNAEQRASESENKESLHPGNTTYDEIEKIKRALIRMDNGQYGICQTCGDVINNERLAVAPFSSMCQKCATQAEGC